MSREWKPGDVAIARLGDGSEVVVIRTKDSCHLCASQSMSHWHGPAGNLPPGYPDVRPLVTIDPEDRDQAKTLMRLYWSQRSSMTLADSWVPTVETDRMQAALRKLIALPKPDEPTGKWAVVEDAKGWQWIRAFSGDEGEGAWLQDGCLTAGKWTDYSQINVRRVVSEGVTP